MEEQLNVLGVCGSLRRASYNRLVLRAAADLMPAGMILTMAEIGDLPMYNQDVYDAGMPMPVQRFRSQVAQADALLIATPEYNFSVPAPLKNAIDWGSRAPNQCFNEKPVAIVSAATGPLGGARVQYDLRRILTQLWAHVLPKPEVFIGMAASKFDADGRLADETTRKFLSELLGGFRDWILRMRKIT